MRVAVIASAPRGGLLHYAAQMSRALAARGHEVDLITARGHELDGPLGRARIRPALPASLRTPSEPPTGVRYLWRRALIAIRVVAASARTLWEVGRGGYDLVLLTDDLSVVPAATGALVLTRMPGRARSRRSVTNRYRGAVAATASTSSRDRCWPRCAASIRGSTWSSSTARRAGGNSATFGRRAGSR